MAFQLVRAKDDRSFADAAKHVFQRSLADYELPNIVLPTGNTPKYFYEALRQGATMPAFTYVQLDEYLGLNPCDNRLFSKWLARDILDPLDIQNRLVFNSAADPAFETKRISSWLSACGPVDIAVLGLGANGHVGFNEPGCKFDGGVHVVDLTPGTIAANKAYWAEGGDRFPTQALTLGIGDLRKSKQTILLVRGEAKAGILARAFHGEMSPDVPASYLQRQPNVTIVADVPALSLWPV